ncbi:hypothetical protein SAMN04515668_2802 [Hymenobacter arizonensis]|uniref:Uncharacterized protein n=1 Tax=Hymenobacter arizonensis TaxID=1227077 RepID=A0A1I5Z876_HYMAR|nr:hypothetical protein SAMN04515668_2802 [Hymenobacter arizonensis]
MKTNRLNVFEVVGSHSKSTSISTFGHIDAISFILIGEVVRLASQTNYGNILISSKS